jgi:glycine/D-amino acid oxidase-like deaminating enzyme
MTHKLKIAIVGAGIGGLTAALALRARGLNATVFERAVSLREAGAGISIQPIDILPSDFDLRDALYRATASIESWPAPGDLKALAAEYVGWVPPVFDFDRARAAARDAEDRIRRCRAHGPLCRRPDAWARCPGGA